MASLEFAGQLSLTRWLRLYHRQLGSFEEQPKMLRCAQHDSALLV
jgi:hypothetical protein